MKHSIHIPADFNKYDVLIIGAGISGLVAAHTLIEKDPSLDILILEATGRIGGRTLSRKLKVKYNDTCQFDFGAHWVSSSQTHVLKYIELLKLHLAPQKKGLAIFVDKNGFDTFEDHPIVGNYFTRFEVQYFFGWLEEHSRQFKFGTNNEFLIDLYDSVSMEEYIDSRMYTKAAKTIVKNTIRNTIGIEPCSISPLYYFLICNSCLGFSNMYFNKDDGAREFWIKEGADEICKRIVNILGNEIVTFMHPVTQIMMSKDNIKVITPIEDFYSSHLICCIPLEEIIKIKFIPDLNPIRKQILRDCYPGHVTKFVITYKQVTKIEHASAAIVSLNQLDNFIPMKKSMKLSSWLGPFWRLQGYSGEIFSNDVDAGPITMCSDATKYGNPALLGIIQEPTKYLHGSDGTYKEEVIKQLSKYWGRYAEYCTDYKEVCWWNLPHTGGCPITALGIGTLKYYHILQQPVGRIHWAGAEIATDWCGFMNGAVQSGYRAAIDTLYDMRPQIITAQDMIFLDTRRTHKIRLKKYQLPYAYEVMGIVVSFLFYRFVIKKLF